MKNLKLIAAVVLAAAGIGGGSYLAGVSQAKSAVQSGSLPPAPACPSTGVAAADVKKDSLSDKKSGGIKITEKKTVEPAAAGGQKTTEEKTTEASWDDITSIDAESSKTLSILQTAGRKLESGIGIIPNYDFQAHEIQTALQYEKKIGEFDLLDFHAECFVISQVNLHIDAELKSDVRNAGAGGKCNW